MTQLLVISFLLSFICGCLIKIAFSLDRAAKNHDEQNEILMEIYKRLRK
jgi:uncharacterized integral membrane protein